MTPELQPGDHFDEFEILHKIGSGSFSQVFLAQDTILDRQVVIKQLSPDLSENDAEWDAFVNEAQVTASFCHPGLITVHALRVDTQANSAILVLEYMNGGTLGDSLNQHGPLELGQVWNLAYQVGDALHYIHQRGMIHRDIKPDNILYSSEMDWYKLTDFGLLYNPNRPQFEALNQGQPGTLRYMSPEQAANEFIDHRSDQYTLAAVLHEALTGQYYLEVDPDDCDDAMLMHFIHYTSPRHLPRLHPERVLVARLDEVLRRALAKSPDERFNHTEHFVRRFNRIIEYMASDTTQPN